MKEWVFWLLYIATASTIIYRIVKGLSYFDAKYKKIETSKLLSEVSIIQIIGNFNKNVEQNLIKNTRRMKKSFFIFLIEDREIKSRLEKIFKNNNRIILLETTKNLDNTLKIKEALKRAKTYSIILDENIELESDISEIVEELVAENFIVNGLIYESNRENVLSKINSTFLNSHVIFNDLSLAEKGKLMKINNEFYGARTKTLVENQLLEKFDEVTIKSEEFSKVVLDNGIKIFQSRVVGRNNRKIDNLYKFYESIGTEIEMVLDTTKDSTSIDTYILTLAPLVLPSITFVYSLFLGINYLGLFVISLLIKEVDMYLLRRVIFKKKENIGEIFLEFFMDIFGIIFIVIRKNR